MAIRKSRLDERKKQLRQRFLERAKYYLGVPYSRKYCQPGTPEYDAPLYLDCCTLVKRCVHDLQDEFGFRFKGFNQNYLFDTLPVERTAETAEPGDIIFFEAWYHEKYKDIQEKYCSKHNIVHVEIFVGGDSGEQSLGSRRLTGVATHDPYWLVGDRNDWYHSVKYHFRSLDTWLEGVCQSFCPLHPWDANPCQAVLPPILSTSTRSAGKAGRRSRSLAAAGGDEAEGRKLALADRSGGYLYQPAVVPSARRKRLPELGSQKGGCSEALGAVKTAWSSASLPPTAADDAAPVDVDTACPC
eukprot:TRINITY_DN48690_c0_g1_i1.p1 TRINITY_DN48690_c0_g1~~TRINITY_DN48690_c0_g1_i1.p1  ORF type:complete len:300 (+),score=69.14 TRINITY_DN48690_c0_g1_i1:96-995(+)